MCNLVNKVKCWVGCHDLYSEASDLDYDFDSLTFIIKNNTVYSDIELCDKLTTLRCRHCSFTFK